MPSWAWVVTIILIRTGTPLSLFQCPHGLELLQGREDDVNRVLYVSMPSWAWVVTARMSNILNFSWYFLCIPAIYKCILAYLPIFFNQLSKFLRCESPSTFLGTCLSHHSFIIFLVTNTNTLLSGLYLISTNRSAIEDRRRENCVNALSGLYLISTWVSVLSEWYLNWPRVNALSGLYLISTLREWIFQYPETVVCQCPLGLIPHFYLWRERTARVRKQKVSMPSRAYTSFLPMIKNPDGLYSTNCVNALSGLYLISTGNYHWEVGW